MKLPGIKRILPLILTVLLLPALMVVPARADDDINALGWYNILDYGGAAGGASNVVNLTKTPIIDFNNPTVSVVRYVDILVYATGSFSSVTYYNGEVNTPLTIVSYGSGYYRIYGEIPDSIYHLITLEFSGFEANTVVNFLEFSVSHIPHARYPKPLSGTLYDYSSDTERFFSYDGQTPMGAIDIVPTYASSNDMIGYVVRMDIPNWQSMDYISLQVSSWSTLFTSLKVTIGGNTVPYTMNTVESADVEGRSLYLIDILIDLTEVARTLQSPIAIDISGQVKPPYTGNFAVQSCYGIFSVAPPSTDVFWNNQILQQISNKARDITTALKNLNTAMSEALASASSSIVSGLSSLLETINSSVSSLAPLLETINSTISTRGVNIVNAVKTWGANLQNTMDVISNNVNSWISAQTTTISGFLDTLVWYTYDGFNQTVSAIATWGQNIIDAIVGTGDPSDVNNEIDSALGELGEIDSVMGSVSRPALDSINFDFSGMISANAVTVYGSIFSTLIGNQYMSNILMMAFILAAASFLLFGRR